jgi:serine/threonine protein kinase
MQQSMPTHIGKYELISPLGHGGMGTVYKAFHPQLQRFVAIKLLLETTESDPDFIARFQREAVAVAQLRHPHIVQVFDFDVRGSTPYMVMEFVEGETLAQRLTRLHRSGQVLPRAEVARLFQQLCSAVAYAHKQGMLHRDLKPQNIIINTQNEIILTDFGLAKIMGASALTLTNATVGTPHYMSPEQAQGQPVDVRSDIYSLGVMLYLTLAGKVPFDASTPVAVLMQHVTSTPPPIREVNPQAPEELAQVAMIAMAKDPKQRFQSVEAMAQAIATALGESPILSNAASIDTKGETPVHSEDSASKMETLLPTSIQRQEPQQADQTDDIVTLHTPLSTRSPASSGQAESATSAPSLPAETLIAGSSLSQAPVKQAATSASIPPMAEKRRISPRRWALIGLIVVVLAVTSGVLGFALVNQGKPQAGTAVVSVGTLNFTDSAPQDFSHPANVVTGTFSGLAQPVGGATYFAWLCDSGTSGCTLLGPVIVDQSGKASLTKTVASNWLGTEDAQTSLMVKITREQTEPSAPPTGPSSDVAYSGNLNPAVLLHTRHQLSAFTKAAPFQKNMTALDVGFGNDALLAQNLAQQLQSEQNQNDLAGLHKKAGWLLSLIAGNQSGLPGPATGDDGFGMGTQAPACTSGLTTTYLPLLIEHACYAYKAGGTTTLQHLFNQLQQTGSDASRSILAMQQIAQAAEQANNVHQVDITTLLQHAQQVLNDASLLLADSEQMATITLYPV